MCSAAWVYAWTSSHEECIQKYITTFNILFAANEICRFFAGHFLTQRLFDIKIETLNVSLLNLMFF